MKLIITVALTLLTLGSMNVSANALDEGITSLCEREVKQIKKELTKEDFYWLGRAMGVVDMASTAHVIAGEKGVVAKTSAAVLNEACHMTFKDKRLSNNSFYVLFKYNAYKVTQ